MKGKEKRTWKRCISTMLALVMLLTLPGGASAAKDYTEVEWKYEDSLLVDVVVSESKKFTPEDFPGIDCKKVFVLKKGKAETGITYQLVLHLDRWGDEELNEAIDVVSQLPIVVRAQRNFEYTHPKPRLILNREYLYLAVNDSADVFIEKYEPLHAERSLIQGVHFGLNYALYNPELLQKDSFVDYGVIHFWPYSATNGRMCLIERPEESEGKKDENGSYYGLVGEESETVFEAMERLSSSPKMRYVSIVREQTCSGNPFRAEYWTIKNTEIAECTLSGGEQREWGDETLVNQTATVCGRKPGVTTLTCERSQLGGTTKDCVVIVYEPDSKNNPGDLDHSGTITAEDALQTLKQTVGLISLDEDSKKTADLNLDGKVNAEDALLMLKITVGSL